MQTTEHTYDLMMGYLPVGQEAPPSVTSDYANYPPYQFNTVDMLYNTPSETYNMMNTYDSYYAPHLQFIPMPQQYAASTLNPMAPQEFFADVEEDIRQDRGKKKKNNYRKYKGKKGRRSSIRSNTGYAPPPPKPKKKNLNRRRSGSTPYRKRSHEDVFGGRNSTTPKAHLSRRRSHADMYGAFRDSLLGGGEYDYYRNTVPLDLIAMACDKQHSLEIQTRIAKLKARKNDRAIETMFFQFLPEIVRLSCDPFANFVIQRIIESLPKDLNDLICKQVKNQILTLSNHPYGCRVMQRIVTYCNHPARLQAFQDMMPDMVELLSNSYGCYVVQTIIENVPSEKMRPLRDEFLIPRFYELAIDPTGTHVVQHSCRYFTDEDKEEMINQAMDVLLDLCRDNYGNYVVQKIIHYGNPETRSRVIQKIVPHVVELSCHKVASNIIEKAVSRATKEESKAIIQTITANDKVLQRIICDSFGNYVVQKMIKILPHSSRVPFIAALENYFLIRNQESLSSQEKHVLLALGNNVQK